MHRDADYMELALAKAKQAYDMKEVPVGAVVVYGGEVMGQAHNRVEALQDATKHAELLALQEACKQLGVKYLKDCTLYVNLEPCPMCAMAAYWLQLSRLVFGANDDKRGYQRVSHSLLHPQTEVVSGLLAAESEILLQKFFQKLRKEKKHG